MTDLTAKTADLIQRLRRTPMPLADVIPHLQALSDEVTRLTNALQYEQHRAERIGTHGPGCHTWGPAHYECLVRKLGAQQDAMQQVSEALEWATDFIPPEDEHNCECPLCMAQDALSEQLKDK